MFNKISNFLTSTFSSSPAAPIPASSDTVDVINSTAKDVLDSSPSVEEKEHSHAEMMAGEKEFSEGNEDSEATHKTEQVAASWWSNLTGEKVKQAVTQSASNVAQTASKGWQSLKSGATQLATQGAQNYLDNYNKKLDKMNLVDQAKQVMTDNVCDAQFIAFYELVQTQMNLTIKEKLSKIDNNFLQKQEGLIHNWIEVNMAKGFANLAQQMNLYKEQIPNYDHQPSLVSLCSFFIQKGSTHLNEARLAEIEEKYRSVRADVPVLLKELFPAIETDIKKQVLVKDYTHQLLNPRQRIKMRDELFETQLGIVWNENTSAKMLELDTKLWLLNERHVELNTLFKNVADDFLVLLFPQKFNEVELPPLVPANVAEIIYDIYVKIPLADFLQESYEPIETDVTRIENWEKDLQVRVGAPDLKTMIKAPTSFLRAYTKNKIQSDPEAVAYVVQVLNSIFQSHSSLTKERRKQIKSDLAPFLTAEQIKKLSLDQLVNLSRLLADQVSSPTPLSVADLKKRIVQEVLFPQLSQEQLANWIIASIQTMLHTKDAHLLSLGHLIQEKIQHLALASMVKGAKLVIPDGETIDPEQFIKELSDRIIAKIGSIKDLAGRSDEFWKNFVQELPIPPILQELLLPKLIKKTNKKLKDIPDLQQIQTLHATLKAKIQSYENGEDVLSLTEMMSEQVIQQVLKKNVGLVETLGFGDNLEELLAQYLPELKMNDDLKLWFKKNISALESTQGEHPQSVILIKQAVQIVIYQALGHIIETHYKLHGKNYIVHLKQYVHQAFVDTLTNLSQQMQRKDLEEALEVQQRITEKSERIQALQKQQLPLFAITSQQSTLIEEAKIAHTRYTRASDYIYNLTKTGNKLLAQLNTSHPTHQWTAAQLSDVGQALILYKRLQEKGELEHEGVFATQEILSHLLELSAEELHWISEAINIEATLKHAQHEQEYLKQELEVKKQAIQQHDLETLTNRADWDQAKQWLEEAFQSRQLIHQLSQEMGELETQLNSRLPAFQQLAHQLLVLVGLDQKSHLKLPFALEDKVWPLIEKAQKEYLAPQLFKQLTPILLPILDIQKNKEKLSRFAKNSQFLPELAENLSKEILEKMKTAVLTPDQIKQACDDLIPGATELQALLGPQLQQLFVGKDPVFVESRNLIQRYVEGMILQIFVKIAEANQEGDQDILAVLTRKLQAMTLDVKVVEGKTTEEVAHQMIDQILVDTMKMGSPKDLVGVPPFLQKIVYEKLKASLYEQLTPLVLPIVERAQNRSQLHELSGSGFLAQIAQALAKDVFYLLPASVNSYRVIARELFVLLSHPQPTSQQEEQFAQEIEVMVKQCHQKDITHQRLLEAYSKVAAIPINEAQQADFIAILDKYQAKEKISDILITPEELAALAGVPAQPAVAKELQNLIHDNPDVYHQAANFAESYVEGMLLRVFIKIAQENPAQGTKDTVLVLTDKLMDLVVKKYPDIKTRPFEEVVQELNDTIMKDILHIDSPEVFEGLPDAVKEMAYKTVKDQIAGWLMTIQKHLIVFEAGHSQVLQAQEEIKKYGVAKDVSQGNAEILSTDIAELLMGIIPDYLTKTGGGTLQGVNLVSKSLENYLMKSARKNFEVAKVLLNYTKSARFQELLEANLKVVADPKQFVEDKQKVVELLSHLLLVPLNKVLTKTVDFEQKKRSGFTQTLTAQLLNLAADHLKNINEAKKIAAADGRSKMLHQDFLEAMGDKLHPAVLRESANYQQSLDYIAHSLFVPLEQQKANGQTYVILNPEQQTKWDEQQENLRSTIIRFVKREKRNREVIDIQELVAKINEIYIEVTGVALNDDQKKNLIANNEKGILTLKALIRREAGAPKRQRDKEAYKPATRVILNMIFPNGKVDLDFVPEELREWTWDIFENHLFPHVIRLMTELVLKPDVMEQLVVSGLEALQESLDQKIELRDEPEEQPLSELDEAAGNLVAEALKAVQLPEWMKKMLIDPKTGEATTKVKRLLGSTLRHQLHDTFIQEKMQDVLKVIVHRDQEGDHLIQHHPDGSKAERLAKSEGKRDLTKHKLKKISRDLVHSSISYYVRHRWAVAQARFDQLIDKHLGQRGAKVKSALDAVFRFIFFKVIGSVLSFSLLPVELLLKEIIYDMILLDQNRESLLSFLNELPGDSPLASKHMIYQEDLVFKAANVVKNTVQEALNEEKVALTKG